MTAEIHIPAHSQDRGRVVRRGIDGVFAPPVQTAPGRDRPLPDEESAGGKDLRTQIQGAGLSCEIFHETVADPTTVVVAGVRMFVDGHDSLVSLGRR